MRNLTPILVGVLLLPWAAYLSWPATMQTPAPRPAIVKVKQPLSPTMLEFQDAAYETQPKSQTQPSA